MQDNGSHVYVVRMRLRGLPGTLRLHAEDIDGAEGASVLRADYLSITLAVGECQSHLVTCTCSSSICLQGTLTLQACSAACHQHHAHLACRPCHAHKHIKTG